MSLPCARTTLIALLAFMLPNPAIACQESNAPDLVFYNAQVITVDQAFSVHQAVAVTGEKILAVGNNDDMLKLLIVCACVSITLDMILADPHERSHGKYLN